MQGITEVEAEFKDLALKGPKDIEIRIELVNLRKYY
jgi:hypothetical protein